MAGTFCDFHLFRFLLYRILPKFVVGLVHRLRVELLAYRRLLQRYFVSTSRACFLRRVASATGDSNAIHIAYCISIELWQALAAVKISVAHAAIS